MVLPELVVFDLDMCMCKPQPWVIRSHLLPCVCRLKKQF